MPKFERSVEIDAPVDQVWKGMTNPNTLSQWFPGVDSISNVTSISQGGSFDWASEGRTGHATIVQLDPMKRLEIMTQVGNDRDSHVFVLQPSGGFLGLAKDESKVDYTLDTLMGGGILSDLVAGGNPADAMRVNKALNLLRKLVESQKA
ncbi:MAG TPA: SRPBCC family protein [Anaerolineaceae bacterium]